MIRLKPSKKIIPILIACLLATGAVVFAAGYSKTKLANGKNSENFLADASPGRFFGAKNTDQAEFLDKISNLDEDGDGIKNWEETLIDVKTNSTKTTGGDALVENLTETDKLSRQFFGKYLESKKNGTLDQEALVKELLNNKVVLTESRKYTINDLEIIPKIIPKRNTGNGKVENEVKNEDVIKNYGNALGFVLAENPASSKESELDILGRALNTNNPEELKKIDPIITGYQKIVTGFLSAAVPEELAPAHLALLNSLQALLDDIRGLKKTFNDPIYGLASLKKYLADVSLLQQALQGVEAGFEDRNITFTQSEYGYVFTHTI